VRRAGSGPRPATAGGASRSARAWPPSRRRTFTAVTRAGIRRHRAGGDLSAPIMIAALAALLLGSVRRRGLALALVLGVAGTGLLVVAPAAGTTAPRRSAARLALGSKARLRALRRAFAKAVVARRRPLTLAAPRSPSPRALTRRRWPRRAPDASWHWDGPGFSTSGRGDDGGRRMRSTRWDSGTSRASRQALGVALEPLTATLLGVILSASGSALPGWAGAVLLAHRARAAGAL